MKFRAEKKRRSIDFFTTFMSLIPALFFLQRSSLCAVITWTFFIRCWINIEIWKKKRRILPCWIIQRKYKCLIKKNWRVQTLLRAAERDWTVVAKTFSLSSKSPAFSKHKFRYFHSRYTAHISPVCACFDALFPVFLLTWALLHVRSYITQCGTKNSWGRAVGGLWNILKTGTTRRKKKRRRNRQKRFFSGDEFIFIFVFSKKKQKRK